MLLNEGFDAGQDTPHDLGNPIAGRVHVVGLVQARCGFVGLSAEFDDGGKLSVAILADAEVETLFEVRDQGLEKLIAI